MRNEWEAEQRWQAETRLSRSLTAERKKETVVADGTWSRGGYAQVIIKGENVIDGARWEVTESKL